MFIALLLCHSLIMSASLVPFADSIPEHTISYVYYGIPCRLSRGTALCAIMWREGSSSMCRLRNLPGGDDARFGMLMGPLGIKLVGRTRPLEQLALMRAILTSRGIKLPADEDAEHMQNTKVHLAPKLCKLSTCYACSIELSVIADICFSRLCRTANR